MNIGVALLTRELIEAGHEVSVMHLNEEIGLSFEPETIIEKIRAFNPGLVAMSFGRNHLKYAEDLVPLVKQALPEVPILCGGIHPTLFPEETIALAGVDFICVGEADGLLTPFVARLERGENVSDLKSFWGKDKNKIWRNEMAPLPDIGNQTWIDLDHIDHSESLIYNRGMFEVVTGRGCPNRCTFCFNVALRKACEQQLQPGSKALPYCRKRNIENLLGEMELIQDRFGQKLKMFSLADDAVNFDRNWMLEFCHQYKRRIGIPYSCNLLVGNIDDELAEALKLSGAIAKIGVESGSERIRNEILGKSFPAEVIEESISRLKAHQVPTRIYLMIANPTETRDEILSTFKFAARLAPNSTRLCVFYPVEGSPIHELCVQKSLLSGREYENYDDLSILIWDADMALFIEKAHSLHAWMQNVYLNERCAEEYGPLIGRVLAMDRNQWNQEKTQPWIRSTSIELSSRLRQAKVEHYFNPFPERPDVTFLYTGKPSGLPNVDDNIEDAPVNS
ncbi:MAG: cobalamin-dependent protein [Deltaproteobacteria bacterium]|nr:cobalamin-dependent protein [Deltaproteobacteria bacterium]